MKFTLIKLTAFLSLISCHALAADYFVATNGTDANPGTEAQPLATIQAGVNKLQPGDTLLVRGGTYRETVTFPKSGTPEKPITLKPFANEKVVISGCDILTGWTREEGNRWKTKAVWTLGAGRNQLFYGGEAKREARHPNVSEPGLELPVEGLNPLQPTFASYSAISEKIVAGVSAKSKEANDWKGGIYYGIHWKGYSAQTGIISSSRPEGVLTMEKPTTRWWWWSKDATPWAAFEWGRGMIVGHRNALDAPGEWVREADGTLLFLAPGRESPEGKVEFKRRHLALDLTNRSHIRVEGIQVKGASALLRGSESCALDRCSFDYITHFTRFDDGRNGHIDKLGDRGALLRGEVAVLIGGRRNTVTNSRFSHSAGGGLYVEGYANTIHNNLIEEISYTCTYLGGVMIGWNGEMLSGGHTITHNTIRRASRTLIHMDGGSGTRDGKPQPFAAMLISNNHLYDGMMQSRDGGLLNSFHTNAGAYNGTSTDFSRNIIHDGYDPMVIHNGWNLGLVYWDNATYNLNSHHNLLWNKPGTMDLPVMLNSPSVNSQWTDNRFHKNHSGGLQALKPMDFPDGKPFPAGHDFTSPPPVPAWGPKLVGQSDLGGRELKPGSSITQAVDLSGEPQSIVLRYQCNVRHLNQGILPRSLTNTGGSRAIFNVDSKALELSPKLRLKYGAIQNAVAGEYFKLPKADLGEGYETLSFIWASANPAEKWLEIRLGDPKAEPIARLVLPNTNATVAFDPPNRALYPFQEMRMSLPATLRGTGDVYFTVGGGDGKEIGQISTIRFEHYRKPVELLPNEGRIEVRLDKPDGQLLTTLYPQATEGGLCETIGPIEKGIPAGKHELHFIYQSRAPAVIRLDALRLERGASSQP